MTSVSPTSEMPLDAGIARAVSILRAAGVETFESCEGGDGHPFREPTVRFHGSHVEGHRAYAVAMQGGLPVFGIQRVWDVVDGELTGPWWQMTFREPVPLDD